MAGGTRPRGVCSAGAGGSVRKMAGRRPGPKREAQEVDAAATRIAATFEIIPASPPARHQWARLRHKFGSKHTNNARNGMSRLFNLRGRKQIGPLCCDVSQCPDESITD